LSTDNRRRAARQRVALFFFGDVRDTNMDGKLVRLRAYEKSDLDAVMKWVNDEEVTDLLGGEMLAYPVSSIAEAKFIEASASSSEKQKNFAIETLADSRYIGRISFNVIDWRK